MDDEQQRKNEARRAKSKAFEVEALALCKKHGISVQAGANILQFAVPLKYTQEQMHEAFTAVQSSKGWKHEIDKVVYLDDAGKELTAEAIIHFAGGGAEFLPVKGARKVGGKTKYRVIAPGYYAKIGS